MNTIDFPEIKRPLAFVDLDDTIFQTARKMQQDKKRYPATYGSADKTDSFMSPVQLMFSEWLMSNADVVPVTARGVDSFQRVNLPFTHGAICNHGGIILSPGNHVDLHWLELMQFELGAIQGQLDEILKQLYIVRGILGLDLRITIIESYGFGQFIKVKQKGAYDEVLSEVFIELASRCALKEFYVHRNGNNLAIIPYFINKQSAVQEFVYRDRMQHGERAIIGFGDSLTDLGFMSECHWWGTPQKSQLANFVQDQMT